MLWPSLADWWRAGRADKLFPSAGPAYPEAAHARPSEMDHLATAALAIAVSQIGRGEEGGQNMGTDVALYVAPAKPPQNWCAGFVGWCYEVAADGLPLPFRRSLGAKRLGANVAAVGRKFMDPLEAKPGDLMVFHRGAQGSWMGHVAMVAEAVHEGDNGVVTIEGNAGPKVLRRTRSIERDRFAYFASVRR